MSHRCSLPLTVAERLDVNESKRCRCRDYHRTDCAINGTRHVGNHPFNQILKILGTRADVIRKRFVIGAVVHPHEATFGTESKMHERASPITIRCNLSNSATLSLREPASPIRPQCAAHFGDGCSPSMENDDVWH